MEKKRVLLGALGVLLLGGVGTSLYLLSRPSNQANQANQAPQSHLTPQADSSHPDKTAQTGALAPGGASSGSAAHGTSLGGVAAVGGQTPTNPSAPGLAGALPAPGSTSGARTAGTNGSVGTPGLPGAALPAGSLPSAPSAPSAALSGTSGAAAQIAANAPVVPAATPAPDACYTITYHHKPASGHGDEEACSHHKNLVQLKHEHVNMKNVCVRVNGTPVHFLTVKDHADQVLIGAVAGPKSKLTVSYCVGKATCQVKEDCTVPKDEFMEAIGGTTADVSKDARLGQWDPSMPSDKEADVLAKLDGDVKRELETNHDLNGRSRRGEMFKDWMSDNEGPACGVRQAKN